MKERERSGGIRDACSATCAGPPHPACACVRSAPGPVPVGGLRIPSSRSFSTTALLCVSFFEAYRSVRRFLLWARAVKLLQIFFGFRTSQFLQVTLAKELPSLGLGVIPLSQFVGGSKIAKPFVQGNLSLSEDRAATGGRRERALRRSATPIRRPASRQLAWLLRLCSIIVSPAALRRLWETGHK